MNDNIDNIKDNENDWENGEAVAEETQTEHSRFERLLMEPFSKVKLTGMYQNWFLDYASYVILERAVPHLNDGLKPVQRRILHAMRKSEDGRYNKVAAIVGDTMHYHPHGDASIGDALVQLGQKDLLIDCQGNWGNIFTGDEAAAPRYIEARLTKFALEVVFNPKTTEWMLSYDGRNNEPVTLPVKFPLLLAQGAEGIAVGLASKILPHNFNELIDCCIAYLNGEDFELYPDFPTGGLIDCSKYNDGLKGGVVRARARIIKVDRKTLAITEIPFGTTSESIKDSIIRANEKGKIKIKKVDDNTADKVEIVIHVGNDESTDKVIDALYAFTDCETAIWPNSCVIYQDKPHFLGVKDILRRSADHTRELLGCELQIRLDELAAEWHRCSLEKIFIENKMYQALEGCTSREEAYDEVDKRLEPFKKQLRKEVTREDVVKLTELKFIRITRYDSDKADNEIRGIEEETARVKNDYEHLTDYTIAYYRSIKARYGKGRERRSELKTFDTIEAATVAVVNSKLYVDRAGGFFGIGNSMKQQEYVCDCSDMDDVIVFASDGRYIITKVSDKAFFAPDIYYVGVFKRNDERTIYNVLYRDGDKGPVMMKRCAIKGVTRDKEYDITKGTPKSSILYMSVNPNGEAEVLKVIFKQRTRMKKSIVDLDFSKLLIKGRQSNGNLFSRYAIHKIVLKSKGASTLSGQNIWFDDEVCKLNTAGRGRLLGEFEGDDKLLVITKGGKYYITGYELGHHFPEDWLVVEKYDPEKVFSVAYWDATQKYYYLKRFMAEQGDKIQQFVDEDNPASRMVCISGHPAPLLEVTYKTKTGDEAVEEIDAESFIGVKSHRAKGKRVSTNEIVSLRFIEPELPEEPHDDGGEDDADMPEDSQPTETSFSEDGTVKDMVEEDGQSGDPEQDVAPKTGQTEPARPRVGEDKPDVESNDATQRMTPVGQKSDDVEFEIVIPRDEDEKDETDSMQLNLF